MGAPAVVPPIYRLHPHLLPHLSLGDAKRGGSYTERAEKIVTCIFRFHFSAGAITWAAIASTTGSAPALAAFHASARA